MDIHCTENRIEIRFRQHELSQLSRLHFLEEGLTFPNGDVLRFAIELLPVGSSISASTHCGKTVIQLPLALAQRWIAYPNQRSIEVYLNTPNQGRMHLLLEKEQCLSKGVEQMEPKVQEVGIN